MTPPLSLGIRRLKPECTMMQLPGLYWVNIARKIDADLFCRQVIQFLPADTGATLICGDENPQALLANLTDVSLKKLPIFFLPETKDALNFFTTDLSRASKNTHGQIFILLTSGSFWQTLTAEEISRWVSKASQWLSTEHSTLLILSYGSGIGILKNQLAWQSRYLHGLSCLDWEQDRGRYHISWWDADNGVTANQTFVLRCDAQGWLLDTNLENQLASLPHNDDALFLVEKNVLEGAPPLSENWQPLDSNTLLAQRGEYAQAATLVFALYESDEINQVAHQIHHLRLQQGSALKIIVRELGHSLRYSDERLLLACGANLVVPNTNSFSQFLTLLESVQGQFFTRHVPLDIDTLLITMRPLALKGYLAPNEFAEAVLSSLNNPLLPEDEKGVLVALRPTASIQAKQALSLCNLRRFGDIVTLSQTRIFLFLSTCRVNDLEIALRSIFQLPPSDLFSNYSVWHQDRQIVAEITRFKLNISADDFLEEPIKAATQTIKARDVLPPLPVKRVPTVLTLLTATNKDGA